MEKEFSETLMTEVSYRTERSSGPGGQHVNKVSTRVVLLFDVLHSTVLHQEQRELILSKLGHRISSAGVLQLQCDETRSQSGNKELVLQRFLALLEEALKPTKKRKATKPGKQAIERRLKDKKKQSEKKNLRKFDEE